MGVEGGYRWRVARPFYLTPWAGLDYAVNTKDLTVAGRAFSESAWAPFAVAHLGYLF